MMKSKVLLTSLIMITAVMLSAGALFVTKDDRTRFLEQRAQLVMREIGHRILLHAGDSTSRVLPVKRITPAVFQIEFQSEFAFVPDTLTDIVHNRLASARLPLNYMVNIFDCAHHEIVYGYEIVSGNNENIACEGRVQPTGCYILQIAFTDWNTSVESPNKHYLFIIAMAGVAGLAFVGRAYVRKPKKEITVQTNNLITIGKYLFDPERRTLQSESGKVALSEKEFRLLQLFADSSNQVLSRDHLLKEVWENEGVFVGRSLDMFVSKLRKKLQDDPNVRLINIHGKGYKLEIDPLV